MILAINAEVGMLRNLPGIIVICAGIAGCATKPVIEADNTPLNRTAVIEQQVVSNGIKGFFPFETNDRRYVRANMRRVDSTFKGTGAFSGFLLGLRSDTEITRIDRKLKWSLDTKKEEYTECPLKGCVKPSRPPAGQAQQPAEKSPQKKLESGCTMRVAHSSFTVKSTGRKKTINGFDTDEYQAVWLVRLRDNSARKSTSTLKLNVWTTPMTGTMRDALEMEKRYARAFNGAVRNSGKPEIMPADAARLISAYLANSMRPHDLRRFLKAGRQMKKIKGYPISTHLAWDMEGNACAPRESNEKESSGNTPPTSAEDLVSGLAGMFAKKKTEDSMKEAAGKPILSLTFEVKKLGIEPVHDSVFTVPKNYRLVSQP